MDVCARHKLDRETMFELAIDPEKARRIQGSRQSLRRRIPAVCAEISVP